MTNPTRFTIAFPEEALADVQDRLRRTRWPIDPGNERWEYGVNRRYLEELVAYWLDEYDWRQHERAMNGYSHFRVTLDGVPVHFIREPGKGPNPMPLICSHGWPWTFWDFQKVIRPLTDPAAFGGDPADAFDVIVPSLPGFGFSTPLERTGVNIQRTAQLWVELMRDVLGYDRFAAQGGDWGALVTSQLGHAHAEHLIGVHLSLATPLSFFTEPLPGKDAYEDHEMAHWEQSRRMRAHITSHVAVQVADPQTLAYGMHESPVALCAWILERRRNWSDCEGDVERRFSKDDLITTAMLYWLTDSFVTSARYYAEAARDPWKPSHERRPVVEAPVGMAVFPREVILMPERWTHEYFNIHRRTVMPAGGHFAPMEEPELLVEDVRALFRPLRAAA